MAGVGGNQIFGSAGAEIFVDIDGAVLKAENNWWGVGTGLSAPEILNQDGSTVDSTPFLTVAP